MARKISFSLSQSSIQNAIKEIRAYQNELPTKCEILCRRLAAEGIIVANGYIGTSGFGKYIHLSSAISPQQMGCGAILYMRDTSMITSEWRTLDGVKSAEISPMLMLEFGSGLSAQNPKGIPGVGTGTFPGGTHGNEPGWYYMDLEGNWHYSSGVTPKMPMYHTGNNLRTKIIAIAKEVFG